MKQFFTVIGVATVLGVAFLVLMQVLFPAGNITKGDEIAMCQPTGWNLLRDSYCAQEINRPNSEANLNNGLAHQANAEATLAAAQALQVARETGADPKMTFAAGLEIGCLGVVVLIFVVTAIAIRTSGKP